MRKEEMVVAGIINKDNDNGMLLIYNDQSRNADEIVEVLQEYKNNDYSMLVMDNYKIKLDTIYGVFDFKNEKIKVLDEDNKPSDILDFGKIKEMDDKQLKYAMSTAIDFVAQTEVEDGDTFDMWLDTIDDVFGALETRYKQEQANNEVLNKFIDEYNLRQLLNEFTSK